MFNLDRKAGRPSRDPDSSPTGNLPASDGANWYQLDAPAVLRVLNTDLKSGLTEVEAARRLAEHGPNELVKTSMKGPWSILWNQLTGLMVVILIIAALLSALLGDHYDAIAIAAIVILNTILGFSQEYRAERAMAALKKLAVPSVRVRRDGEVREIEASRLVRGDIVLLEAGNLVPADSRVLESADLQTHEAALTGESEPIRKVVRSLGQPDLPLGDRRNMAYMGTFVTAGRGQAVVSETGMATELGRIATLIQTVDRDPTPLQRRLQQLGKGVAAAALFLVSVIFTLGFLQGNELKLLFMTAVSIAVAAVPEGLPAVVTIALTLGAQRMLKRRVLIRKLPTVETLGSVTTICSDKTGTLTQNRMTVEVLQMFDRRLDLASLNGHDYEFEFRLLLAGGALSNDAYTQAHEAQETSSTPIGDPTEAALVVAAEKAGLRKSQLERSFPRIAEAPFSSERKRMTTVHRLAHDRSSAPFDLGATAAGEPAEFVAFTKGSVDGLLEISDTVWIHGRAEPLDATRRDALLTQNNELANRGMRVLGVAFRLLDAAPRDAGESLERQLTFVGMVGMIDPPRPEAAEAVAKCKTAGIRTVMITGDHPLTAGYIAEQLGLDGNSVLTGPELDRLSANELERVAENTGVYARVSPEHKLKLVETLQRTGQIVAMTGDGVNDAPALKKSDIGVAMGMSGTDVAKEAADMVLLDDNFATIVSAVEEGRVIYDNVRKFIKYILATNSGEIWLMLVAPLCGMPLPLLPLQILWINLVTDGLPALALGIEPAEHDAMRRPPHNPNESIFARGMGRHIIWVGLLMGLISLGVGYSYLRAGDPAWQTMVFTTLTLSQMAHVMAIRSERTSLFRLGLLTNAPLLGAVALTVLLQLALVYVPALQAFFRTLPLGIGDLAVAAALSSTIFAAVEVEKWISRRRDRELTQAPSQG